MRQSYYIRTLKAVTAVLLFTPFSLIAGCAYLLAGENSLDPLPLPDWISEKTAHWFGSENTGVLDSVYATTESNNIELALRLYLTTLEPIGYVHAPAQ